MLHAVPSLMRMWMATAVTDVSLPHLRWLFMAGEPLSDSLIQRWYTLFPDQGEFVNLYGPTETTLAKCYYRVSQCLLPGVQPLGRPLPQTQVLVLAEQQRLCGIGEPGEIVIRTPFRSLGYINAKEEQTARFFPNPFMDDANDVVYATGDLGCYGPDGTLQFLGRMDYQLKIRGVRVEPGSIEATLSHHPDVNACVVMARQDETGETLLVAYLVRTPGAETTVQSLRQFLHQRLPAAMIPSIFIWLDVLPLNANGKVNRRALPNPDAAMLQTATDYIAPRSPFERELADIWAETLQVTRIGISDDFFDLGGHSLLAVQLVSRVREAFHVEMPLRQVFDTPTIAEMADAILHHEATQVDDKILSQLLEDLEEMSSDDVAAILTDGTQIKIGG
jgi:acyl-coenzyme A synthetase/AMP-(fatty) acid ligase/acyl carrier protein